MRRLTNILVYCILILTQILVFNCNIKSRNSDKIAVSGIIEAIETEIRSQVQGKIVKILVKEGQEVKKGELLCLIDKEKLEIQLNQIRARIEMAKLKLRLYEKGTRKELIAVAENQLESAKKELEIAKINQERMERLLKQGAISKFQKEKADLELKLKKEKYESALENYKLAKKGKEKEEIGIVKAEIKNLLAQEKFILSQIQDTEIRSPINGYVEIKHIEVGELALPGTILFTLINLDQTYVKAYIPEKYLGVIKLGNLVEVISDSYPNRIFKGKIDFISDEAEFVPKEVQTKEERLKLVFMVKSYLNNCNRELKPGMPVDVKIKINNQ